MFFLVYRITNTINGKHYTGAHETDDRNDSYMGSGVALLKAIQEYGRKSFRKEILFEAESAEEMFAKEKELVVLGSESYNLMPGGRGGPVCRASRLRARSAQSDRHRNNTHFTKEGLERLRQAQMGKKATIETRLKMSAKRVGITYITPAGREALSMSGKLQIGKTHKADRTKLSKIERRKRNTQLQRTRRANKKENLKCP